jgi:hypothetical protein
MLPLSGFSKFILKKLSGVILLWGITSFSLWAQSDGTPVVTLSSLTGSSREMIRQLESSSGWVISYSSRLCTSNQVTLRPGPQSLLEHLNRVFANCPFDYTISGKRIILRPGEKREVFYVVSGFITDAQSSEYLPSAGIYQPGTTVGTISNNYGFYSLSLPAGKKSLRVSYVGYPSLDHVFDLKRDTVIDFKLMPTLELEEISVVGSQNPDLISISRMGAVVMSVDDIRNAPSLMGETDLIKNIQMLPGVQGGSEGFSGLYVRGGGPDQNLILLDDVPVYNIGHLLGFFSIFNADAVKHVSLLKGGFPARYGDDCRRWWMSGCWKATARRLKAR